MVCNRRTNLRRVEIKDRFLKFLSYWRLVETNLSQAGDPRLLKNNIRLEIKSPENHSLHLEHKRRLILFTFSYSGFLLSLNLLSLGNRILLGLNLSGEGKGTKDSSFRFISCRIIWQMEIASGSKSKVTEGKTVSGSYLHDSRD